MTEKRNLTENEWNGKKYPPGSFTEIELPKFCIPFFFNGYSILTVFKEFKSKSEARDAVKIYFYYLERGIDLFYNFQDVEDEPYFGYCESLGIMGNVYTCYFTQNHQLGD